MFKFEEIGQCVYHGHADAMETAGDLVRGVVEFTARVQHGHDDLGRRNALFAVDIDRNTTAVVRHRYGLIRMDPDHHSVAITGERFVDRVIDDLEHHVMQAAAVVGIADVHPGPLSNGVEAFQDFDFTGIVDIVLGHSGS